MTSKAEIEAFASRLGHRFQNPGLLQTALTHSSVAEAGARDNQRLEFLGDRVLGLVIAEALLNADKSADEGKLAPRLNALVRKETCAEIAREIDLGAVLRLARSEAQSGGRRKTAILGDAMEAVLAAVYLDAGFGEARKVILALWNNRIQTAEAAAFDAKSALQEWAQARALGLPDYQTLSSKGPDHEPVFTISVTLENGATAQAKAPSKRAAQQQAAEILLNELESTNG